MSLALLDVNVLVALVRPAHESHNKVQNCFQQHAKAGWATCPMTQAALARIVSNPSFSPNSVSATGAIGLLKTNVEHPSHRFWRDEIGFVEAAGLSPPESLVISRLPMLTCWGWLSIRKESY